MTGALSGWRCEPRPGDEGRAVEGFDPPEGGRTTEGDVGREGGRTTEGDVGREGGVTVGGRVTDGAVGREGGLAKLGDEGLRAGAMGRALEGGATEGGLGRDGGATTGAAGRGAGALGWAAGGLGRAIGGALGRAAGGLETAGALGRAAGALGRDIAGALGRPPALGPPPRPARATESSAPRVAKAVGTRMSGVAAINAAAREARGDRPRPRRWRAESTDVLFRVIDLMTLSWLSTIRSWRRPVLRWRTRADADVARVRDTCGASGFHALAPSRCPRAGRG